MSKKIIIDIEIQETWKTCPRGHKMVTARNYCPVKVAGDVCGQTLSKVLP